MSMRNPLKILLFIPTYNCENQISRVLAQITPEVEKLFSEILIVDNRSTDNTINVAQKSTQKLRVKTTILKNSENFGLGGSIKRAFLYGIENQFDYVMTFHGDDQALITDMTTHFSHLNETSWDLLIGARFHPNSKLIGYSKSRTLGNQFLNLVCGWIHRKKVYDMIAGINLFKVQFIQNKIFLNFPDDLTFDAHLLTYTFDVNGNLEYIPITWRDEDQVSNAKVIRQALIILKLLLEYWFKGSSIFNKYRGTRAREFVYTSESVQVFN